MSSSKKPALVLLSGGIDSATAAAIGKEKGYKLHALSVDYGQRHSIELQAAKRVAKFLKVAEHRVIQIDLRSIGGSALTANIKVPKKRSAKAISKGIPTTYVPARNSIFLAIALGYAETIGAFDIFIGANAIDYSGYPDCRPEFLRTFEKLANLATKAGVEKRGRFRIHAPLLHWSKARIITEGKKLGLDYSLTHSCYDPGPRGKPCRQCDSCLLRQKGFEEAGLKDPL